MLKFQNALGAKSPTVKGNFLKSGTKPGIQHNIIQMYYDQSTDLWKKNCRHSCLRAIQKVHSSQIFHSLCNADNCRCNETRSSLE